MRKVQIKCFIASAFDKSDVDKIFKNILLPLSKKLKFSLLRVDKVEHNDDIDDKIFSLLDESDFCIADLTYARPSVYYESGYAVGKGKPVIFIARSDHFKAMENDPQGNLKIHFDLQMKNIISWDKSEKAFMDKLEKRLKKVISPTIHSILLKDKESEETKNFNSQSLIDRTKIITVTAKDLLKRSGFTFSKTTGEEVVQVDSFFCTKVNTEKFIKVRFYCKPSVTKRMLNNHSFWFDSIDREKGVENSIYHYIFVTYSTVSKRTIVNCLTKFYETTPKCYSFHEKNEMFGHSSVFYHFLDNFKNLSYLKTDIKELIKSEYFKL